MVAIHNKNGKGLLPIDCGRTPTYMPNAVAIHNKNGKGLLRIGFYVRENPHVLVAIHNKNGKGLLHTYFTKLPLSPRGRNPQ